MSEATFTFRIDEDLKAAFSEAARSQDRTVAQLLRDFMRDYVRQQADAADYDAWFRREVQAAIDDPTPGIPSEEIEAEFAARRAKARLKLAKSAS